MRFEFATANRILFGAGMLAEVGPQAAAYGKRALVAAGVAGVVLDKLLEGLAAVGVFYSLLPVEGEPTIASIRSGLELVKSSGVDLTIGIGGGSALDTAKAIGILARNTGDITDYLEVIGKGKSLQNPGLPCIAIPTTAGTGAEVTRNAVLGSPEQQVKVSLRSPFMLPRLAIVDPETTYSLPPEVTASTGLDALTQLIEPYVSNAANPLTDAFCEAGMPRASRSLLRACESGSDAAAREDMCLASLFGGLALANSKLGAVHGFASVLGGCLTNAPHGAICARLLPVVMEANIRALQERQANSPALRRYQVTAVLLNGKPDATAEDGRDWVEGLCRTLHIPSLSAYGLERQAFPDIIEKSAKASSTKGNPIVLTGEEMQEILERAL